MNDNSCLSAAMSIDTKKGRIRLHKAMLRLPGSPRYIQLLVHPIGMTVAVRCVDLPLSGEPVHKISEHQLKPGFSGEIYSRCFVDKLSELAPTMREEGLYRISGEVTPSQKMAVFDLRTLKRI